MVFTIKMAEVYCNIQIFQLYLITETVILHWDTRCHSFGI